MHGEETKEYHEEYCEEYYEEYLDLGKTVLGVPEVRKTGWMIQFHFLPVITNKDSFHKPQIIKVTTSHVWNQIALIYGLC